MCPAPRQAAAEEHFPWISFLGGSAQPRRVPSLLAGQLHWVRWLQLVGPVLWVSLCNCSRIAEHHCWRFGPKKKRKIFLIACS